MAGNTKKATVTAKYSFSTVEQAAYKRWTKGEKFSNLHKEYAPQIAKVWKCSVDAVTRHKFGQMLERQAKAAGAKDFMEMRAKGAGGVPLREDRAKKVELEKKQRKHNKKADKVEKASVQVAAMTPAEEAIGEL